MKDKAALIVTAIAGVLAYLGLAALGWGDFVGFFSKPAFIALTIVTIALAIAAFFTSDSMSAGVREDRSNRWVIAAFSAIGPLLAFLPPLFDRRDFLTFDGETIRWFGVVVAAAGGALRIWPVFVLGRRFSGLVAIQPGHTLVTDGVYSLIRHPSYLGLMLNALGWSLAFRSGVGLVLTALLIPPLIARVRSEEALLAAEFGAAYDAYRKRTWRLVPGLY